MNGPIRCEKCGRPIELAGRADIDAYLWTGRCRACRVGRADFIGMIENVLGIEGKETT